MIICHFGDDSVMPDSPKDKDDKEAVKADSPPKSNARKHKKRAIVSGVVFAAIGVHVIAAFIAGAIMIVNEVINEAEDFKEAPIVIVPQKRPEYKVNIHKLKKQSAPPRPRTIVAHNPNDISLPSIDIPKIDTNITITGRSSGGFGVGVGASGPPSSVTIKGISAKGNKIFIIFSRDSNIMMNSRGGFYNYNELKKELTENVKRLLPTSLFNALAFTSEGNILFNKDHALVATIKNKAALTEWIDKINKTPADVQRHQHRTFPSREDVTKQPYYGKMGFSRGPIRDIAAAMNQQADLIFYIGTAFPATVNSKGKKEMTTQLRRELDQWYRKLKVKGDKAFFAKYQPIHDAYYKRRAETLKQLNEVREKDGLPPMVAHTDINKWAKTLPFPVPMELHIRYRMTTEFEESNVLEYMKELLKINYLDHDLEKPSVNIIIFRGEDEDIPHDMKKATRRIVDFFDGKMKVIKGLKATD